jgi:hypothetical protein
MLFYLFLTALTFYVIAFMVTVPAIGPIPSPVVKALLFAVVHIAIHKMLKYGRRHSKGKSR